MDGASRPNVSHRRSRSEAYVDLVGKDSVIPNSNKQCEPITLVPGLQHERQQKLQTLLRQFKVKTGSDMNSTSV
jgi:hypothetical protein